MPKLKFEDVERETTKGRLFPVYLIYGPEYYLVRLLVDKIQQVYQSETNAEVERFVGRGIDMVSVIDGLKTLPMWSKGKLVTIGDADKLSAKSKELLEHYLSAPSESTVLILTSEKFDGRAKIAKIIDECGALVKLTTIYESQMPFWINRECRAKGYTISQDAALFMTELVGIDLAAMAEAVEKIILYIGKKKAIDLKDVETVLSDTSQKSIFDLTKAVGMKNLSLAENRLTNLLRNNENPVVIVNMLARHWRLLLKTKEVMDQGKGAEQLLTRELKVHPFFVKDYIQQSKGFTKRVLVKGLKKIWGADVSVKSSRLPRSAILHRLVLDLAQN